MLSDANVLFSRTLRDYVLYAADEGTIEVHWSRQILAEMSRNLRENLGLSHDSTARLEQLMNDYIEYALVEVDPGHLAAVEALEMDAKDRVISRGDAPRTPRCGLRPQTLSRFCDQGTTPRTAGAGRTPTAAGEWVTCGGRSGLPGRTRDGTIALGSRGRSAGHASAALAQG